MTTTLTGGGSGPFSGTNGLPHDHPPASRPPLVQDILTGDEDAVLSFQLAVRLSLSLNREKVRGQPPTKDRLKVSGGAAGWAFARCGLGHSKARSGGRLTRGPLLSAEGSMNGMTCMS